MKAQVSINNKSYTDIFTIGNVVQAVMNEHFLVLITGVKEKGFSGIIITPNLGEFAPDCLKSNYVQFKGEITFKL